jgi:hypothetical protein
LKYSSLNHELHTALADIAGQLTAADLIGKLNAQIVRHQFQLSLRAGRPEVSLAEHVAMAEAVIAGDPAAAEQAVRAHLDSVIAGCGRGTATIRSPWIPIRSGPRRCRAGSCGSGTDAGTVAWPLPGERLLNEFGEGVFQVGGDVPDVRNCVGAGEDAEVEVAVVGHDGDVEWAR